ERLEVNEVEPTNPSTVGSGQLTDSRGNAVKDCPVAIFARDERQWYEASRYVAQGQTDQQGRFTIRGLPAGDYYAAVVDSIDFERTDPELLARIRNRAVTFSLGTDQTMSLMLRR